jgi:hypothetical protein
LPPTNDSRCASGWSRPMTDVCVVVMRHGNAG